MKKKLTHRQQQFLSQFLDIYRKMEHSVHYVTIGTKGRRLHTRCCACSKKKGLYNEYQSIQGSLAQVAQPSSFIRRKKPITH